MCPPRILDSGVSKKDEETSAGPVGDLPDDELRTLLHWIADWAADYRADIGDRPITPEVASGEIAKQLVAAGWTDPAPMEQVLREFQSVVVPGVVHWGHPGFLGYFGSTSNGPALIGEIAAAALNVSAMTWQTSPAATEMESVTHQWIRELIGLPEDFFGITYDTASIATLHALAAARERCGAEIRQRGLLGRPDLPVLRIYTSDQAHSSVEKAAVVLGIGERNVVRIATDGEFRLHGESLRHAIEADEQAGLKPLAVVATVGTTSTASVDRIREISKVCVEKNVWLHVDAAYGGAMGAIPEGRWATDGIGSADSVVVNPHKWLFVPLDFSALYTRHPQLLRSVFALVPEYLEGDSGNSAFPDYMDYGIQLGRRFRALKAWMVFRSFGKTGISSRIREHCRLAQLFASWVRDTKHFVVGAPVTMGVVCFRYAPAGVPEAAADAMNDAIVEKVNASGHFYLTQTRLRGRVFLRIGLGNVRTTEAHLALAWRAISDEAARLASSR